MKLMEKSANHLLIIAEVTNRCNYKCPYCYDSEKPVGPDFFSIHGISEWLDALRSQFGGRDLELYFTGGEVFVYKEFMEFLPKIMNEPNVRWIRIDTNGSLAARYLSILDPEKVSLMMTFHPTQVSLEKFLEQAQKLNEHGVLEMVNYVAYPFEIETINKYLEIFSKQGIFLNVSPNILASSEYDFARIAISDLVTPEDAKYRLRYPVYGKPCLSGVCYAVADLYGNLYDCRTKLGNLFAGKVETLGKAKRCKRIYCDCTPRYCLLTENSFPASRHLIDYVNRNSEHRKRLGLEYGFTADQPHSSYSVPGIPVSIRARSKAWKVLGRLRRKSSSIVSRISRTS